MAANHGQWKKKGRVQRRRWTRRRFDSKQGKPYAVNECCFFQDKGWSDWFPYGGEVPGNSALVSNQNAGGFELGGGRRRVVM